MYYNDDIDYLEFIKDRSIYIFGAGNRGKILEKKLLARNIEIKGFIDNDLSRIDEKTVFALDSVLSIKDDRLLIIISTYGFKKEIKEQLLSRNIYTFITEDQIDFNGGAEYFDDVYYEWYEKIGIFSANFKYPIFSKHVKGTDVLVDYGCGGGWLLEKFGNVEKIGIDINDSAREACKMRGINTVKYIANIKDEYADVVISSSTISHVENPLGELRELYKKIKPGGKAVFQVASECGDVEYVRSDINNMIYTWNRLNLGNLFKTAGFFIRSVESIDSAYPEKYESIRTDVGEDLFRYLCNIEGIIKGIRTNLIVAEKTAKGNKDYEKKNSSF